MADKARLMAQARRLYADLVVKRSSVRMLEPSESAASDTALHFIAGLYRSGTTALRYSMSSHPEIAAPPESDFLMSLLSLRSDERGLEGLESMGFSTNAVDGRLRHTAMYFFGNYAQSLDRQIVIDKSPLYTFILEDLVETFPDAKFVALFRNPFGQIRSLTESLRLTPSVPMFPTSGSLENDAAAFWTLGTSLLIDACTKYPDRFLPVPYEGLCRDPQLWLSAVLEHLGIDWSDAVLSYETSSIDIGKEGGKAAAHKGFVDLGIDISSWTDEQVATIESATKALATGLGYQRAETDQSDPQSFRALVQAPELQPLIAASVAEVSGREDL